MTLSSSSEMPGHLLAGFHYFAEEGGFAAAYLIDIQSIVGNLKVEYG